MIWSDDALQGLSSHLWDFRPPMYSLGHFRDMNRFTIPAFDLHDLP